jgi:hypothetical protein
MKQGSADDPFADDSSEDVDSDDGASPARAVSEAPVADTETKRTTTQTRSLPYIHSRDGVKDGRKQRPVFLREHIESGIEDLVGQMEAEFGESVYKTDVTEAAMAVAQENPALVQEKLDEWGYGWD